MAKDVMSSKKICATCKKPIKKGQDYLAMVVDEEWEPTMSTYDLLTKPHTWKTYHSPCPPLPAS